MSRIWRRTISDFGGPQVVNKMLTGIAKWMEDHEYSSVHQMQGSMNQHACADPAAFERGNYMQALHSYA